MSHPMQPIEFSDPEHPQSVRFKPNGIVRFLLNFSHGKGVGLNELGDMPWPQEDWDQFYQLIGMSVSGYSDCSLVSNEAKDAAEAASKDARSDVR